MVKRTLLVLPFVLLVAGAGAQNIEYVRAMLKTLCSPEFSGRGYVNDGDKKAAEFIADEFTKSHLQHFGQDYFQPFGFPVITFPGHVDLSIDGLDLAAGYDFIVNAGCREVKGSFSILYVDSETIDNNALFHKFTERSLRNYFLVVDDVKAKKFIHSERASQVLNNDVKARGLIYAQSDKLTWDVSTSWEDVVVIRILRGRIKQHMLKMDVNIQPEYQLHQACNVIGWLRGKLMPDSFIVLTAHYDHLGMLGRNAYFPGANDNASGTAMMLDLLQQFVKSPPPMSVLFIAFAGEEAGLLGSYYYVQNPAVPLNKISLLINLDLMGTGDKGMTVVNATEFPDEFNQLVAINSANNFLPQVASRGKAQNSDHYYFTEAGVKSFFFYLMGDYHHYHDVEDAYEVLPLSKYDEAFKLVYQFLTDYMNARQ
jgi:hypothetical protein